MGIFLILIYIIYQLFWTQACPEGMSTNGTQVPYEVPSLPNPTTRKGWPHHRSLRPLLFSNSEVGSFTSHENKWMKVLWDRTYSFSSLSEKTRKTNHLQMTLQRQHFLLSYLKTLRCWSGSGLRQRPPARQTGALPTELTRRRLGSDDTRDFRKRHWSRQGTRLHRLYSGSMKRLPGDGRELAIVRASEPCVRKIEKVEKTVIRKKVNRKLIVVNGSLTPKSPLP